MKNNETIDELEFFKNSKNHIQYNSKCKRCTHNCKQSFRVDIIKCPKYESKYYERKHT